MASKSKSLDKTSQTTKTNVVDRRAVQQQGLQILDSVVHSADDKIVSAALGEVRAMLNNMGSQNSVTLQSLLGAIDKVAGLANKNQIQMSEFSFRALENARRDLRDIAARGEVVLELSTETVGKAMSMAERVADDQAKNQAIALEILRDAKTGDAAELAKSLSAMVMGFSVLALFIMKGK